MTTNNTAEIPGQTIEYAAFGPDSTPEIIYVVEDLNDGYRYYGDSFSEAVEKYCYSFNDSPCNGVAVSMYMETRQYAEVDHEAIRGRLQATLEQARQRRRSETLQKQFSLWEADMNVLRASADDYSPQGYEKKLAELEARKPVMP